MPFTVKMPKLSPTMTEGTIAKWHKKEGDFVEAGALLLEIATDKATIEHNALDEGWLRKILVKEGSFAPINGAIAIFTASQNESFENYKPEGDAPPSPVSAKKEEKLPESEPKKESAPGLSMPSFAPAPPSSRVDFDFPTEEVSERLLSTPYARTLAKEQGLDLSTVKGTGPGGVVTSHDLEKAQQASMVTFGHREIPTIPSGTYEEIPLSPLRKIVAKRLQEAKTFIPHFYVTQVIDASPLVSLREQLRAWGVKVTFNDLIIRASALALRKHPHINCGFHAEHQTILQFQTIDISVAVTVDGGLITPIIRYADYKNVGELSVEMRLLAEKARKGKLSEHEYKGGSFTVSNLGMYGISEFAAILNPPQAAILAVGGIQDQPVVKDGVVVPGKTLSLTLSVDHRVIDGAEASQFLKSLQQFLEAPAGLIV